MYSTKKSILMRIYNFIGLNNRFHKIQDDKINYDEDLIISPVEAKLVAEGKINETSEIISKSKRIISLEEVLGNNARLFNNGFYLNFYLSPKNKHYWRTPYEGRFISTKINEGEATFPIFIGLEKIFKKIDFFEKVIRKNASIGSILQTKYGLIGMIAIGSLNVNNIQVFYEENKDYKKGDLCGNFNLGSSMLLCFLNHNLEKLIKIGDKVSIGKEIVKINYK